MLHLAGTLSRPYIYDYLSRRGEWKNADARAGVHICGGGQINDSIPRRKSHDKVERISAEESGGGQIARFPKIKEQQILESFYYCRDNAWMPKLIPHFKSFLLDSGAFTFMQGKAAVDWRKYVEDYADFINRNTIDKFFELDIDSVVGLAEVERLRERLERLTGRKPIPVWHLSRGKEYFSDMCRSYPYVAIGGIVSQEIPRQKYEAAFPYFINTAHRNNCKIHGLGYTSVAGIHKYHFDSVDSTAWLYGNRGGYLYKFNPVKGIMDKIETPKGCRLKSQEAALHNFLEWNKFQKYTEKYL